MQTLCNDPINVIVAFTEGTVRPWKMKWDGALYHIRRVNMIHGTHEGRSRIFYFSCSDDANAWKLRFNAETLEWKLVEYYVA